MQRKRKTPGTSPGSLVYSGVERTAPVSARLTSYNKEDLEDRTVEDVSEVLPLSTSQVTWLAIDGVHNIAVISRLGETLQLHPLLLEDLIHTRQRPKLEDWHDHLFLVLRFFELGPQGVQDEQVSLLLGQHYVVSLTERPGTLFDPVRARIQEGRGRIRTLGADYLLYALLDAVVDHYFVVLDAVGEKVESLEELVLEEATQETLEAMHDLKSDMIQLRKSVWPLREVVNGLLRKDSGLISEPTKVFLRDVHDHTIQVVDMIESYRDSVNSTLDIYLSLTSKKLNEVMKVLTIIATIFMPMTLIVGIYGMNFDYMPELHMAWAYPAVWGIMFLIGLGMVLYFRKKDWL